jgi:PAT family beta-lactamase induction signal transducer AmpG
MESTAQPAARPWGWVPTLYFAQGLPYIAVTTVSVVMYKNFGVSNTDIGFYTRWLYLPWVIKPLWSPLVDLLGAKRHWITALQFVTGAALALVALTLPGENYFRWSLAVFWLIAFSSATHDIAADGFYLLALPPHQRAAFVGVRSTFYRLSMVAGQGGLVYLAGLWQERTGDLRQAWLMMFGLLAGFFMLVAIYHLFALPRPADDRPTPAAGPLGTASLEVFAAFFRRPDFLAVASFILVYRLGESQLVTMVQPFLLDARTAGGLGLSTKRVGLVYGGGGMVALLLGGLLGGFLISRHGLKRMLWPMLVIMHTPNLLYVYLAAAQPTSLALIGAAVAAEQFAYGFGFTACMVYLMLTAEGPHQTAHYAIGTGIMALGMMVPGMAAGWIQEHVGYVKFFAWVCLACVPSFLVATRLKLDPAYGRKTAA